MVPIVLLLILLVIAWPIFAIFGGTLIVVLGSHLNIIIPTALFAIAYAAFLAPIAKRNNIKLGGKFGEPLDPTKPIGPAYRQVLDADGEVPPIKASLLHADQWTPVVPGPVAELRIEAHPVKSNPNSNKRAIVISVIAFAVCAPLTVMVLDAFSQNSLAQGSPTSATTATLVNDNGLKGQWHVASSVDPMTDAKSVRFTLSTETGGTRPVTLIVECSDRTTSVGIHWNEYLAAETAGPYLVKDVAIRLGSGRPETKGWVSSPDQTATWAGHPTTELVLGLMENAKVAAQVTPYNSSPVAVSFDTSGLQGLIEANAGACGLVSASTARPTRLIVNQTLTGWVEWDGEEGSINGQGTWAHFNSSTPGRDILFAGCEIKTTVSVPCKVTFGSHGDQIVNFITAGAY